MFWKRLNQLFGRKTKAFKQFADLTPSDFLAYPVWIQCHTADYDEPWYDETDEESFRPWTGSLPTGPEEGMLLVKATLTLIDGRMFSGFLTPQHSGEDLSLGIIQPQLFLPSGTRCSFWDGMYKHEDDYHRLLYDELCEKDPAKIFPIKFVADAGLTTGIASGQIPGFCWQPKDKVKVYY